MRDDEEPSVRLDQPRPLNDLSVEELDAYAGKLERELDQVREVAQRKRAYMQGAESLFKSD
ncbi:DUF1192 family protein [Rhodovibrio salinarum]|uniref:DUF1192 domain-containing protein n=1 Tax=Rhodovibrio salinarum TaxID=1087 RepID=A0A934UZ44_9PROT|nr:DUF1192 family protein [Rhodovibrio salinarum]MBK1696071.1 DUF1192 domain-containing protein [Rhodovibrio salinarum]